MIWRDLLFDYLWERVSTIGRVLIVAALVGAIVLAGVAIVRLGGLAHTVGQTSQPATTTLTSTAGTP